MLNEWPNAISNVAVEIVEEGGGEGAWDAPDTRYQVFVIAEDRHLIAEFEGNDGNGCYGTGWWLSVRRRR